MAVIAKELLKYKDITKYTGMYESYLRENTDKKFWLVNTNRLVKFYPGVDGLKTGYTREAKYCLTATAQKNGMRVIAVVFGVPTSKERNAEVAKMFDYAFNQYETHPLYERNTSLGQVPVSKGDKESGRRDERTGIHFDEEGRDPKGQRGNCFEKSVKAPLKRRTNWHLKLVKDGKTISEPARCQEDVKRQIGGFCLKIIRHVHKSGGKINGSFCERNRSFPYVKILFKLILGSISTNCR